MQNSDHDREAAAVLHALSASIRANDSTAPSNNNTTTKQATRNVKAATGFSNASFTIAFDESPPSPEPSPPREKPLGKGITLVRNKAPGVNDDAATRARIDAATAKAASPTRAPQHNSTNDIAVTAAAKKDKKQQAASPPRAHDASSAPAGAAAATSSKKVTAPAPPPIDVNCAAACWLQVQARISSSSAVKVVIKEPLVDENGQIAEYGEHTYVYFANSAPTTKSCHSPDWLAAVSALNAAKVPHTGNASSNVVLAPRSARVVRLHRPTVICLDLPSGPGNKFLAMSSELPFPFLGEEIRTVSSLELLPDAEAKRLHSLIHFPSIEEIAGATAAAHVGDRVHRPVTAAQVERDAETARKGIWEQHPRSDADVAALHANFGKTVGGKPLRDLHNGHHRAFMMLVSKAFAAYGPDSSPEEKHKLLVKLMAIPKLHLRTLKGNHSSTKRDVHLASQLQGNVCTQREPVDASAPTQQQQQQRAAANDFLTAQLEAEKTYARVIKLTANGEISAANKLLQKSAEPPAPHKSMPQTVAELENLHPNGPTPNVKVPPTPLHSIADFPILAIRKVVNTKCTESSPGPSGWTPELLRIALTDADFAAAFQHLLVDILNGALPSEADLLLSMSNIVGIPKATGGTRPIAMGETFLKIAADLMLQRIAPQLKAIFKDRQLGVSTRGGAEIGVHVIRDFVVNGIRPNGTQASDKRVLVALDMKNAFNMPLREAIYQALVDAGLVAALGIFKTCYAQHADMFVVGSDGEFIIKSRCGARQGTVDGSAVFSVLIQPALDEINDTLAGVFALAYLDDTTFGGDDLNYTDAAVARYTERMREHGSELQPKKCELFMPGLVVPGQTQEQYEQRVRAALDEAGIPAGSPLRQFKIASCIKLLGANVATTLAEEKDCLEERIAAPLRKHLDLIARLPASPQALTLLRSCFLSTMSYALRTHHPHVTTNLARELDVMVEHLVQTWSQGQAFGIKQSALIHAPRSQGGLGLGSLAATAAAAYASSRTTAMSASAGGSTVVHQRHIMQATQDVFVRTLNSIDPTIGEKLELNKPGANGLCGSHSARLSPDAMGAWLRMFLACPSENAKTSNEPCYSCPGCSNIRVGRIAGNLTSAANPTGKAVKRYTAGEWLEHVIGCAAVPGGAVTKRHNALCVLLVNLLKAAGYTNVKLEPRTLGRYDCPCSLKGMSHDAYVEHRDTCPKAVARPRHHGPDVFFTKDDQNFALDVRVCNELAATHRDKPLSAIFADAEAEKNKHYGDLCAAANATLVTIGVSALGALSDNTKALLKNIAADTPDVDFNALCAQFSARAAIGSAEALLTAETFAGIRPTPRAVSIATLKLLEATLDVSLVPKDHKKQQELLQKALPTPPSRAELQSITERIDQLLAAFDPRRINELIGKAVDIKREEHAAQQRALQEADPVAAAAPSHVVRLPSTGTRSASTIAGDKNLASLIGAAAITSDHDEAATALREAREYGVRNARANGRLLSAEAFAAIAKSNDELTEFLARVNDDTKDLEELLEETAKGAAQDEIDSAAFIADLNALTAERLAAVATVAEQVERATVLDETLDIACEKFSRLSREISVVRNSASAVSARNSVAIQRAESQANAAAAAHAEAVTTLQDLSYEIDRTITSNQRALSRSLEGCSQPRPSLPRSSPSLARDDPITAHTPGHSPSAHLGPCGPTCHHQQQQHLHHQNGQQQQQTPFAPQNPNFSSERVSSSSLSSSSSFPFHNKNQQQGLHSNISAASTQSQFGNPTSRDQMTSGQWRSSGGSPPQRRTVVLGDARYSQRHN